ncbi:uncharacterized protein LOC144559911 [Carex rostrata]
MGDFNIDDLELLDVPLIGRKFTWSSKRSQPTFSRLDRVLISPHWDSLGVSYQLQDASATASDHSPLIFRIKPHQINGKRSFKFETYWLQHPQITEIVQNTWEQEINTSNPIKRIHFKINKLRSALRSWAHETYARRETYLTRSMWVIRQLDFAEETRNLNSMEFMLRIRFREHVFKLAKEKEERWKQRSGATWLKLGDNNTKYFHAVANGRSRVQNGPFKLTGRIGPNQADILQNLDCDISDEEIKGAIFQMPKGKASGPDGFPIEFYQFFWGIVGVDIIAMVRNFYNGRSIRQINKATITLIPKKQGAIQIAYFRPISVINTTAKIVTEILANRLQPHLQSLVLNAQTAFVKGRSIMESFLVARELLNFISKNKIPSILYKVDFAKAFDTVDWCFLVSLLIERGFPPRWLSAVLNVLQTSSSTIRVNGSITDYFDHKRGLRQGDPLLPMLFILVTDSLN